MVTKIINSIFEWVNERIPIKHAFKEHLSEFYVPKNLNIWYLFGIFSFLMFGNQILTGIWLTMSYVPTAKDAFASVEYIMRDVNFGWLIRYMHSTGASFFFIVVYLHMYKAMMYGSYKKPRELLWIIGVVIFFLLIMEAFLGYLLPWGNMSYWGAQVITSLFGAIPYIGEDLVILIRGDYTISTVTLNRFFALHVIAVPLAFCGIIALHIISLHEVGNNNPEGIEIRDHLDENGKPKDGIPFWPYYVPVKYAFASMIFLTIFFYVVFFDPTLNGFFLEAPNFTKADALVTPEHIVPVWYMTPFYAILRAIPDKLMGVVAMTAAIVILFFLPWLDRSPVKSIKYKGIYSKLALVVFTLTFLFLGYLGTVSVTPTRTLLSQIGTCVYFGYFLLMPLYTSIEKTKPVPSRIK